MNRVTSLERKTPQLRGAKRESVDLWQDTETVKSLSYLFHLQSNKTVAKGQRMSRGGTVPWGRIQAHNPRPRTTGVGPATINFVINPSLQANAVDFVKESAFGEGFLSLKMSTRG